MNSLLENQFEEFEKPLISRRKLLPWWIKTFCWIFLILVFCGICTIIGSAFTENVNLSIYGFSSNTAYSATGMLIIAIMVFKGFSAYSLWFEKNNAILIAKIDAIFGIVICIISMFATPFITDNSNFDIRLELLLLIPYFVKLNKIEYEWNNQEDL